MLNPNLQSDLLYDHSSNTSFKVKLLLDFVIFKRFIFIGIHLSERSYYRKIHQLGLNRKNNAQSDQEVTAAIHDEVRENGNTKGNDRLSMSFKIAD